MEQDTPPRHFWAVVYLAAYLSSLHPHQKVVYASHFLIFSRPKPGGGVYIYMVSPNEHQLQWNFDPEHILPPCNKMWQTSFAILEEPCVTVSYICLADLVHSWHAKAASPRDGLSSDDSSPGRLMIPSHLTVLVGAYLFNWGSFVCTGPLHAHAIQNM